MDRRNRDEAVQAAHKHFYKFKATARTLAGTPDSPQCFYVQILFQNEKKTFEIGKNVRKLRVGDSASLRSQQILHKMMFLISFQTLVLQTFRS